MTMRRSYWWILVTMGAAAMAAGACTVSGASELGGGTGDAETAPPEDDMGEGFDPGDEGGADGSTLCDSGPDDDQDGDGFTFNDGDCNDCDANVNPNAIEVLTDPNDAEAEPADENCNDEIDEVLPACDGGLIIGDMDPLNAAAAIDICHDATSEPFGAKSASWVRANGSPVSGMDLAVSMAPEFGVNAPRNGDSLLILSSGYARDAGEPDACAAQSCDTTGPGVPPPGFPQDVPGCDGDSEINDDIALEVELVAPSNATGYSFDFAFMSFEFPEWVCTSYNDQFIALVDPAPQGSINGNISFDAQTNPVSVNVAYFDNCDPAGISSYASLCFSSNCPGAPNPYCPLGPGFMQNTGFNEWGDSGSTGWLVTTAPVTGGDTFKIRFAIWDTGDAALDSTVLVDNFRWIANSGTVAVGTIPVPQ
jgi:hypothetical protein